MAGEVEMATYLGAALAIGIAAIATGLAQGKIGVAVAALIAENPDEKGIGLVLIAIPETIVVLGFVISIMILLGIGG